MLDLIFSLVPQVLNQMDLKTQELFKDMKVSWNQILRSWHQEIKLITGKLCSTTVLTFQYDEEHDEDRKWETCSHKGACNCLKEAEDSLQQLEEQLLTV